MIALRGRTIVGHLWDLIGGRWSDCGARAKQGDEVVAWGPTCGSGHQAEWRWIGGGCRVGVGDERHRVVVHRDVAEAGHGGVGIRVRAAIHDPM